MYFLKINIFLECIMQKKLLFNFFIPSGDSCFTSINYCIWWYRKGWSPTNNDAEKIPGVSHFSQGRYTWVLSRMVGREKLTFGRRCYWFYDDVRQEPLRKCKRMDIVCLTRLSVQCRQFDPVSGPFSMNNERSKLYFYTLACLPDFSFPVHHMYVHNPVMFP